MKPFFSYLPVADISKLSAIRVDGGMVQWDVSSNIPLECYSRYALQLSECKIESFTILPALRQSDDAVNKIISSESIIVCICDMY